MTLESVQGVNTMSVYNPVLYRGDYSQRQKQANTNNAICYVEQHFNSFSNHDANYSMAVTTINQSSKSKSWGAWYAQRVAEEFGIPSNGVKVAKRGDRGYGNLCYATMPALLVEPFFISNEKGAQWAHSETHRNKLAEILSESIREFFPAGGMVVFSVGHMYKTSSPSDRGASCLGGGTEAEFAELVIQSAMDLLGRGTIGNISNDEPDDPIPVDTVSSWAADAAKWVEEMGISDGTRPHDTVTREELWTMLHRFSQK